jgi:hypothetical protein
MLDDLSSILTIVRLALFIVGIGALTLWATRQPDQDSALIKKLTERNSKCAGD